MGIQILIGIVVILVILIFYMVWSVKYQSKIGLSGEYKNFGFSYIGIAQVVNLLISLLIGTLLVVALTTFTGNQPMGLLLAIGVFATLVTYYLLNFSVVKFRNTAIIAKTNTEILKQLEKILSLREEK